MNIKRAKSVAPPSQIISKVFNLAVALGLVLLGACRPGVSQSNVKESVSADDNQFIGNGSFPIWAYDAGPDVQTPLGHDLVELNSKIPYFPGLSQAIYGDQMFRPAFGPIPWRMMQKPDSVKILFIGQDGTHIAEAAGRPATAGFGGRAQDLAAYFGVGSSAAFINTFAFTIRWQYGAFDTPILSLKTGVPKLTYGSFTGNPVWLLSQDGDSPIVKWRNQLIEWIIRNNRNSLKMIVLFGGGARDAAGSFIVSKGGQVGTRYSQEELAKIQVPEFDLVGAGSNKQTSIPLSTEGKDLFKISVKKDGAVIYAGQSIDYTDPAAVESLHKAFMQAFNQNPDQWLSPELCKAAPPDPAHCIALSKGGLNGSGLMNPAQLGGYDIDRKMVINNQQTISLKGLQISPDLVVDHDILVTQLPHPTALSMMTPAAASLAVGDGLKEFKKYVDNPSAPWSIEADPGFTNSFALNQPYKYSRGDMGTEYYDFGAPNSRMVNVSTASRSGANVIVFGTRDKAKFDDQLIKKMTLAQPSTLPPANEMWISRPISTDGTTNPGLNNRRYTFDPGPPVEMAKVMKKALPRDAAFVKSHEVNGDFGHYRGTFKNPEVVILADPDGEDDLITARALTGSRGQYLQGLMNDIGVGENYLVIKTAPYSSDSSDPGMWPATIEQTKAYREALLAKLFESVHPKVILTDGPWATQEFARIFPTAPAPVVPVTRQAAQPNAGLAEAATALRAVPGFESATSSGKMVDIPRSHLTYYARAWEGTSGDRVVTSIEPQYRGIAFAEVAPQWAYKQNFVMSSDDIDGCRILNQKLADGKLRFGGESVPKYLARIANNSSFADRCSGPPVPTGHVPDSLAPSQGF